MGILGGGWILLMATACGVLAAQQSELPVKRRDEGEIMLFAVMLKHQPLADAVPCYPLAEGRWLIPFGELCRMLALGVKVQPRTGVAEGFIIREARTFRLDAKAGMVELQGRKQPFDRSLLEWHEDDLYVDAALVAQWFPLTFKIDPFTAIITIDPSEPFPIQLQWARDASMGKARGYNSQQPLQGPVTATPYAFLEMPFIDQTVSLGKSTKGSSSSLSASGSTYLSGDMLWMGGEGFFGSSKGDLLSKPRLTLARRDPRGNLLGPLHATLLSFGDNFDQSPEMIGRAPVGRGVVIGNLPEQTQFNFDRRTFRGNLPPGWTAELYQNNVLVSAQRSRPDGLYEFQDVPLLYGVNDFRTVLYGPEGQHREESTRLDISRSQTPPGTLYYKTSLTRGPLAEGLNASDGGVERAHEKAVQGQMEVSYGLSKQLAVSAAYARVPDRNDQLGRFGVFGVDGFFPGFSSRLAVARDGSRGTATSLSLGTGFGFNTFNLKRVQVDGFSSNEFKPVMGRMKARTSFQMNLSAPRDFVLPMQFGLEDQVDDLEGGGQIRKLTTRLSTFLYGTAVSNSLIVNRSKDVPSSVDSTQGMLLVSKFMGSQALRGIFTYGLDQGRIRSQSHAVSWDTSYFKPFFVSCMVSRDLLANELTYAASLTKYEGRFGISADLKSARSTGLTAGLTLKISLAREPRSGRWVTQARPMAGLGAVSATAFIDANNNGIQDQDEVPIEGAELSVNGSRFPNALGQGSAIFSPHLMRNQVIKVGVATESLEDIYLKPSKGESLIVPRPGKVTRIEFPLVVAGEASGTAYLKTPKGNLEFPDLALELLDGKGKVLSTIRTSFDGFFDFIDLLPGDYVLRVAHGEADRLGVRLPPPRTFRITATGSVFDGLNFVLESDGTVPMEEPRQAPESKPPPSAPPLEPVLPRGAGPASADGQRGSSLAREASVNLGRGIRHTAAQARLGSGQ